MKFACLTHIGPYPTIGKAFERLCDWIKANDFEPAGPFGAFYMDDPANVPAENLRSYAGVQIAHGQTVQGPEVTVLDVPFGTYAQKTHLGPYEGLGEAWQQLYATELAEGGMVPDDGLCFELYMNDSTQVEPKDIRTDIYVSIK